VALGEVELTVQTVDGNVLAGARLDAAASQGRVANSRTT